LKRDDLTFEDIRVQCNSSGYAAKDADYQMPSRNKIRLWARQVLWNMLYFRNAPFQLDPDPFEMCASDGLPYYPYIRNPQTGKPELSPVVSAHEKPIDEVYKNKLFDAN
jgi:hypothetical protein